MKPINRRNFTTGIVAATVTGRAVAASEPRATATPQQLHLKPNGWMPNSPLPVLLYRSALPADGDLAIAMEHLFTTNGWPPQWRDGVYPFHHYHSTAHEVLGFAAGYAELMLGGEGHESLTVKARDVLVLPTGTGHCRISASDDFLVIGAYPTGEHWDICRSAATPEMMKRMRSVRFPASDPLTGATGALPKLWPPSNET
jgi:uncharacterized protein YjlB